MHILESAKGSLIKKKKLSMKFTLEQMQVTDVQNATSQEMDSQVDRSL